MKEMECKVCGNLIPLKKDKTYLVKKSSTTLFSPGETHRAVDCPLCGCQNLLAVEYPRVADEGPAETEVDTKVEAQEKILSVPLTMKQIIQMNGRLVVVPESVNRVGGIGIVNLSKNVIDGCPPTEQYAWPLDRYGELFVAYSIAGGESDPAQIEEGT